MTNNPLPREQYESKTVICIIGVGETYGYGHFFRILSLQKSLRQNGITLKIISSPQKDYIKKQIVILDKRDSGFPPWMLKEKKNTLITLDNQGLGRQQAHIVWDTLPHPTMNGYEFKQTLRRVMLPNILNQNKSKANQANIKYLPRYNLHDQSILKSPKQISIKSQSAHIDHMIRQDKVYTYFGQTLFEAIYLGKEIHLYSISPYHKILSIFFMRRWSGLKKPNLYLDGGGVERLTTLILSLQ